LKVLVTGANGFIAKNLIFRLEQLNYECIKFTRDTPIFLLEEMINSVDFVYHLAGVNRPKTDSEFLLGNYELTKELCRACSNNPIKVPIVYASSTQAKVDNFYGISKLRAEDELVIFQQNNLSSVYIYRLTNVFGRWSKPNYNSVVATFCYNKINNIPLNINDPLKKLSLVYIDNVVDSFINCMNKPDFGVFWPEINEVFEVSVGRLSELIESINDGTWQDVQLPSEKSFTQKLYKTYLSFR
jgi:UDP-2-acetamido-2,6-beta-L-arabino-hexul-4-ose reductase